MTTYQLTHEGFVIRDGGVRIPIFDFPTGQNTNPDFLAYKEWLAAGGVPEPADPAPVMVPVSVTMRQARLALLAVGKLQMVEAAIAALPDPPQTAARIEWDFSNEVHRYNGFVEQIGPAIGLDASGLDELFIAAGKL